MKSPKRKLNLKVGDVVIFTPPSGRPSKEATITKVYEDPNIIDVECNNEIYEGVARKNKGPWKQATRVWTPNQ